MHSLARWTTSTLTGHNSDGCVSWGNTPNKGIIPIIKNYGPASLYTLHGYYLRANRSNNRLFFLPSYPTVFPKPPGTKIALSY